MNRTKSVLAGVLLSLAASPAFSAEKVIVGNEGTYPPFSMMSTDGQLTGIEPEMTIEMCKRAELDCEFAVMDFKALIPSLLQGKVDMVGSQVKPLAERKAVALFSIPIIFNHDAFVVKKDATYDYTDEGMKGVRIGVQRGSSQAKYIAEHFPSMEAVLYDNPDQIRLDLLSGRIEATFGAKLNWTLELIDKPEGKDWAVVGNYWTGDESIPEPDRGSSWIVRKGEEELLKKMDAALSSMIEDCTVTKIRSKYISVPIVPGEAKCL
ncbi:transporter substrate-binding domain-containing protein [Zavarzinia compransoris]|uniref:transporter substrate-binding domain-containing protein n=1 Tax=Zavarzinia marina TaxID=2911065 RepID=UPI001F381C55|nr:transporter substrate-binding domain-containing protein [Zavarzinia marina]MCF4166302.1 transporter substrate-binding domain-containing protein [Zavarzinia marina]